MTDAEQAALRQCDFCDEMVVEGAPFGTAEDYVRYPDDREDGVEEVRVCGDCALSSTETTEYADSSYIQSCDLCGAVGYNISGAVDGDRWRISFLQVWRVHIRGLTGCIVVCRDCTPIKTADMFPSARHDPADYTERYGPDGTAGGAVDVSEVRRV